MENFTLLFATDYSETAANAEHYAIQFAKSTGSFIRFLHAFETPGANETGIAELEKSDYNPAFYEMTKLKSHIMKTLQFLHIDPSELNYECIVREGSASKQILEELSEVPHDFIIMGTHGESGLRSLLFGSHTATLIKKSGTPVLAIPVSAKFSKVKEMVFATEYREGELPVINFLTSVAKKLNAGLSVLHISSSVITAAFEKKVSHDFMNELQNKITFAFLLKKIDFLW